jgi:hypothetical protein
VRWINVNAFGEACSRNEKTNFTQGFCTRRTLANPEKDARILFVVTSRKTVMRIEGKGF